VKSVIAIIIVIALVVRVKEKISFEIRNYAAVAQW